MSRTPEFKGQNTRTTTLILQPSTSSLSLNLGVVLIRFTIGTTRTTIITNTTAPMISGIGSSNVIADTSMITIPRTVNTSPSPPSKYKMPLILEKLLALRATRGLLLETSTEVVWPILKALSVGLPSASNCHFLLAAVYSIVGHHRILAPCLDLNSRRLTATILPVTDLDSRRKARSNRRRNTASNTRLRPVKVKRLQTYDLRCLGSYSTRLLH